MDHGCFALLTELHVGLYIYIYLLLLIVKNMTNIYQGIRNLYMCDLVYTVLRENWSEYRNNFKVHITSLPVICNFDLN